MKTITQRRWGLRSTPLATLLLFMLTVSLHHVRAQCPSSSGTKLDINSSVKWSQITELTACNSQLTTNGGSYTGNLYLHLAAGVTLTIDVNVTINGNVVITNNGSSTLKVDDNKTFTVVGDLGDASNNNVIYTVNTGAVLIVTGTIYGKNSNQLGGTGSISAGAVDTQGGLTCADGGCPNLSITTCDAANSTFCSTNNSQNTCATTAGGIVSNDQIVCSGSSVTTLTASGYSGYILRWEKSTNGGSTWTGINNVSNTYSPGTITTTTKFRIVVLNTTGGLCNAYSTPATITVPVGISGSTSICRNSTTTFTPTTTGGTWASSNNTIASVSNTTGIITGNSNGNATITYTVNGCASTATVTVSNTSAATPTISGVTTVCQGSNTALVSSITGGTWSSSNTSLATVATTNTSTGTVTGVGPGTVLITWSKTGTCNVSKTTSITVNGAFQWRGTTSTAWGTTANWACGNIPTTTSDVIIPAGATNMPTISNAVNVRNITIANSATLTISGSNTLNVQANLSNNGTFNGNASILTVQGNLSNSGTFNANTSTVTVQGSWSNNGTFNGNASTLTVQGNMSNSGTFAANTNTVNLYGNWINNGTFNANTSTVEFKGGTQTITNGSAGAKENFYNLTINSTGTVVATSNIDILAGGTLKLTKGVFNANFRAITLKSAAPVGDVDKTARLAKIETAASLTNASNFKVQRYIPLHGSYTLTSGTAATHRYIFLAPAVTTMKASDWANDMKIIGGAAGTGFQSPNSSTSSLAYYSELNAGSNISAGWRYITTPTSDLTAGTGYRVFAGLDGNDDLVEVTGTPVTGNFSKSVTYTAVGTQGWNLVGNPYASEINLDQFYTANSGVMNAAVYILDPNNDNGSPNSSYFYYIAGTNGAIAVDNHRLTPRPNSQRIYLASSQAFFINAKQNGNLQFTEAMKANTSVYANFRQEEQTPEDLVKMSLTKGELRDQALVYFNDAATEGYDKNFDATKLAAGTISITTGHTPLAINGVPNELGKLMLPINLTTKTAGEYNLVIDESHTSNSTHLYIFDRVHNKYMSVGKGLSHSVDLASGKNENRFFLTNEATSVVTGLEESLEHGHHLGLYPNPYHKGTLILNLEKGFEGNVKMEVLDAAGAILKIFNGHGNVHGKHVKVDLSHQLEDLMPGTYIVRCINGEKFEQEKLVVVR